MNTLETVSSLIW